MVQQIGPRLRNGRLRTSTTRLEILRLALAGLRLLFRLEAGK